MVSKKLDIEKQLVDEHEALDRRIRELRLTITGQVSIKDFPDWRVKFIGRLRDLKQKLINHFEFEERGGFMTGVTDEAPQFLNKVKDLEIEHKRILSDLDDVMRDFKALYIKDDLELKNIFNRLSNVMNTLHHHEMSENELMQSAFYREHGSPD